MKKIIFLFLLSSLISFEQLISKPLQYPNIENTAINSIKIAEPANQQDIYSADKISYPSPVDTNNPALYKLISINAIDINNKHSPSEMIAFEKEAKTTFDQLNIIIDWDKHLWYYLARNTEKEPGINEFIVENDQIRFINCIQCQDNKFNIINQTPNTLSVQLKPQDEDKYFVFQLEFKK